MIPHQLLKVKTFSIFKAAVEGLQPGRLIAQHLKVRDTKLLAANHAYDLDGNVYVVGFGKAVAGMALSVQTLLRSHLVSGMLSVPVGSTSLIFNSEKMQKLMDKFTILEGAKNNLPDEASQEAANRILNFIWGLRPSDILVVLVSGGGSALFPMPIPPVTLQQKREIVEFLSKKGATIQEINVVRKRLSMVKGGGLVELSPTKKIIGLIMSDIVGNPLDLIASGPTVLDTSEPGDALNIIHKYCLQLRAGSNILTVLEKNPPPRHPDFFKDVTNIIIGSNDLGLEQACHQAELQGFVPYLLTNSLTGRAQDVGVALAKLATLIEEAYQKDQLPYQSIVPIFSVLKSSPEKTENLLIKIRRARFNKKGLCLVLGGETTVELKEEGGLGGRNQHLALSAALEMDMLPPTSAVLLSAGTDGIDGPTDAAGAFAYYDMVRRAAGQKLDARFYLIRNDSHSFYFQYNNGEDLIKTGHTGTNCMDIILLTFGWDIAGLVSEAQI